MRLELLDGTAGMGLSIELAPERIDDARTRVRAQLRFEVDGVFGWFTSEKDLKARRERKVLADLGDLQRRFAAKASSGSRND